MVIINLIDGYLKKKLIIRKMVKLIIIITF